MNTKPGQAGEWSSQGLGPTVGSAYAIAPDASPHHENRESPLPYPKPSQIRDEATAADAEPRTDTTQSPVSLDSFARAHEATARGDRIYGAALTDGIAPKVSARHGIPASPRLHAEVSRNQVMKRQPRAPNTISTQRRARSTSPCASGEVSPHQRGELGSERGDDTVGSTYAIAPDASLHHGISASPRLYAEVFRNQ